MAASLIRRLRPGPFSVCVALIAMACGGEGTDSSFSEPSDTANSGGTQPISGTTGPSSSTSPNGSGTSGTTTGGTTTGGTSTGGAGSGTGGSSSTDGSDDGVGGSAGSSMGGDSGATTDASGGTGAGGGAGETGCSSSDDCEADEWCDFPDDLCGDGELGSCKSRPIGASDGVPTCGCDGAIRLSPWFGWMAGVDADAQNRCVQDPEANTVSCGGYRCFGGYCQITETPCATHFECISVYPPDSCTGCDCAPSDDGVCTEDDFGWPTLRRTVNECLECFADPFSCE